MFPVTPEYLVPNTIQFLSLIDVRYSNKFFLHTTGNEGRTLHLLLVNTTRKNTDWDVY